MRLEQNMGMNMEQKLTMDMEQRLEMRQEMTLKMTMEIEGVRNEVVGEPTEIFGKVIDYVLETAEDPKLKEGLKIVFEDKVLLERMLREALSLSVPNKQSIKDVVAGYIHTTKQGTFEVSAGENMPPETKQIPLGIFGEALNDPEKLKLEIEDLKRIAELGKDSPDNVGSPERQIIENMDALKIAEDFKEYAKVLGLSIGYILTTKHEESAGLPEAQEFLRETIILRKLDYILSERTQKRFVSRFSRIPRTANESLYKNAFMNTVSEYVLTSMGVIDPEIFTLKKADIDENEVQILRKEFSEDGLDLDKIFKHYALSSEGTIFWNRWKTLEQRPGRITDERIRAFITETVRADDEELLKLFSYPDFFNRIKEIVLESGNKLEEREDLATNLRKELADFFSEENIRESLVKFIKERWYPKLTTFYKDGDKK